LSFAHGQLTTADSSSRHSPSIQNLLNPHSNNTDILLPINIGTGCPTCGELRSLPPTLETNREAKRKRLPPPSVAELAENTAAWLKEGFEKLSAKSSLEFVSENFLYQLEGDANACAKYLWD
jgi:hypothetical protein